MRSVARTGKMLRTRARGRSMSSPWRRGKPPTLSRCRRAPTKPTPGCRALPANPRLRIQTLLDAQRLIEERKLDVVDDTDRFRGMVGEVLRVLVGESG